MGVVVLHPREAIEAFPTCVSHQQRISLFRIQHIGVLNFASAKNPGGGWESGALAQEETLARASGLVPCLKKFEKEMYEPNRATRF